MSALSPEADITQRGHRCPLSATSGHFSRVPVEDYKITKIAGLRGTKWMIMALVICAEIGRLCADEINSGGAALEYIGHARPTKRPA
jgi:hypothetical protein